MKIKVMFLIFLLLTVCSCSNVRKESLSSIINNLESQGPKANTIHTGYKYYLPVGLSVEKSNLYNDIITSSKYTFYLYADVISYYNKSESTYEVNKNAYYSEKINYDDKFGYIEINLKQSNQYLIEIMFNYAKIEVIVDYNDIAIAVNYAVSILKSIEYNDNIIANILGEDVLNYQEENYNIFNTTSSDSNYLQLEEAYVYEEKVKDEDLIN